MTNDKSGVWEIGEHAGANAMADENPVNDYKETSFLVGRSLFDGRFPTTDTTRIPARCTTQVPRAF